MSNEAHIVIYDGDCGFCQKTVSILKKFDWLRKFDFKPFQDNDVLKKYDKLSREMCEKEIFLIQPNGNYYGGYDAFKMMALFLPITFLFSWFFFLPGVTCLGRIIYKNVAQNRHKIKIGKKVCKSK